MALLTRDRPADTRSLISNIAILPEFKAEIERGRFIETKNSRDPEPLIEPQDFQSMKDRRR